MGCTALGSENRAEARFCNGCGAALAATCASCGQSNPPGSRFCDACGQSLTTPARPNAPTIGAPATSPQSYTPRHLAEKILAGRDALTGERKQVTILFADVVGSTELIQGRDAEDAQALLDGVVQVMMDAVHRFEGTVSRLLGDGLMAMFGAPVAHEDHAVRACYAALPITDSYTRHHGALGSFAWVHLSAVDLERARDALAALDGVEEVYTRAESALIYEHPADRIGDLSVASDARTALGKARAHHDLSLVAEGLRSHGGRHEQIVPILTSHPLREPYATNHRLGARNSDLHDLLLNGLA